MDPGADIVRGGGRNGWGWGQDEDTCRVGMESVAESRGELGARAGKPRAGSAVGAKGDMEAMVGSWV